eukprot:scaffold8178_cov296-Pinguiococcus_pyrenoidosus.AAC.11
MPPTPNSTCELVHSAACGEERILSAGTEYYPCTPFQIVIRFAVSAPRRNQRAFCHSPPQLR